MVQVWACNNEGLVGIAVNSADTFNAATGICKFDDPAKLKELGQKIIDFAESVEKDNQNGKS